MSITASSVLVTFPIIVLAAPLRSPPAPEMAPSVIRVDVRGAVAHVTVTRALPCGASRSNRGSVTEPATDAIVDLALPEQSALLSVDVATGGRFDPTRPVTAASGRDAYLESLRTLNVRASEIAFEENARVRIRVACRYNNTNNISILKYSFSTLLDISGNRARLVFPASPELSPPAARIEVRVAPPDGIAEISIAGASYPVRAGVSAIAGDTVSTRARWQISFGPIRQTEREPRAPTVLASTGPLHSKSTGVPSLAFAIGLPVPRTPQALPERVLFLVDRSRSVGPGGLEAERDVGRRILEALPPTTRFDALFFDRGQKRLFPLARVATREAIAAFEDEMVPARLANGTELGAALRAAGDLLRRESSEFGPRALVIILSDGALGIPANGAANAGEAQPLGPLPGIALMAAAISVRPNDDPSVSTGERRILRALTAAAPLGGVERAFRRGDIGDAVPAVLEALRAGGEIYAVRLGAKDAPTTVADAITPGDGVSGLSAVPGSAVLAYFTQGQNRLVKLHPVRVDEPWLLPLSSRDSFQTRLLVGPAVAALVEPVVRPAPPTAADDGPRGYMERSVVRDALSLAFTPRARACYLNRNARTAADRDLSGRVRLALDLVRGEVGAARIEASTLAHPLIETCLREAAFALDVPRAYRNDDPVTAVLNLVFRPRTPERRSGVENPSFDREIDLVVEAALKDSRGPPIAPAELPDAAVPER